MNDQIDSEKEIPILVDLTGKCVWLKQEGEEVYAREEIGYIIIDDNKRLSLRSPVEGTLKSILIHGDMIADASEEKVPVALVSTCLHAYVLNNLCINCQKVITDLSDYRQVITYDGFVEYLKQEFYEKERVRIQAEMLQNRKLGLVFDLDNTLIEQSSDMRCKEAAKFGIPGVNIIQFTHYNHTIPNVIMVRGGVQERLKELSAYFDLSIYTNGTREYAEAVVNVIDPNHSLFGNRIIARNDVPENSQRQSTSNFDPASKDISLVLPGYDDIAIAVDDSIKVWKDQSCVIPVPPFRFWGSFLRALDYLEKNQITEDQQRRQEMFNRVSCLLSFNDMMILFDSLKEIHRQFFKKIPPNTTTLPYTVSSIIKTIRSHLFQGRILYFDTVDNKQTLPYLTHLTKQMGGTVSPTFTEQVTHFISSGAVTQTLLENCLNPTLKFVNEYWLNSCYSFAICLSSKGYPVRGLDRIRAMQKEKKERNPVVEEKEEHSPMMEEKKVEMDPELADVLEELDIMERTAKESRRRERQPNSSSASPVLNAEVDSKVPKVSEEEQRKRRRNLFLGSF